MGTGPPDVCCLVAWQQFLLPIEQRQRQAGAGWLAGRVGGMLDGWMDGWLGARWRVSGCGAMDGAARSEGTFGVQQMLPAASRCLACAAACACCMRLLLVFGGCLEWSCAAFTLMRPR
jgi:hypothetical protein